MITPILATLDPELTIRSANGRARKMVGKSVYDLVPSSHHHLLNRARRELFEQRRLVSREVPALADADQRVHWWLVRAAPLCDGGRAVAAIAQVVPRGARAPREYPLVSVDVWQRELALRELDPILRRVDSELFLSPGRCFDAWEPAE